MANAANDGTLIGRLASDPRSFLNQDGSKKVVATLYVDRAYKNSKGETVSDQIQTEAWVSSQVNGLGPYAYVHQGDLVAVSTHIEQQPYKAKNGETVYPAPKIVMDDIKFLEPRGTTQARMAKRAAAEGAPTAEAAAAPAAQGAPANDTVVDDAPFGANA